MRCHRPTRDYFARRTAGRKTKPEIMRCLKRYIAREVSPHLLATAPGSDAKAALATTRQGLRSLGP
jgi:hypothetical protein